MNIYCVYLCVYIYWCVYVGLCSSVHCEGLGTLILCTNECIEHP